MFPQFEHLFGRSSDSNLSLGTQPGGAIVLIQYNTVLQCIVLLAYKAHCTVLYCDELNALPYTSLYYAKVHCTALYCSALHCTGQCCIYRTVLSIGPHRNCKNFVNVSSHLGQYQANQLPISY